MHGIYNILSQCGGHNLMFVYSNVGKGFYDLVYIWSRNLKFWYRNCFFYAKKCKQNSSVAHRWGHAHFRLSISAFLGRLRQRVVHIFWKLTEELLFHFLTRNSSQNWRNFSFQYVLLTAIALFRKADLSGNRTIFWLAHFDPKWRQF